MGRLLSREGATPLDILTVLNDGNPRTSKEIDKKTKLGSYADESVLRRICNSSTIWNRVGNRVGFF